jgi:predicted acylesterase/phospholipase RssA
MVGWIMSDLDDRIGLALSGGGFRATLFHLGVIRFLSEVDLLKKVKLVSAVSGGSILAAHLILIGRDTSQWQISMPQRVKF